MIVSACRQPDLHQGKALAQVHPADLGVAAQLLRGPPGVPGRELFLGVGQVDGMPTQSSGYR